jgi:hypothetical protein
VPAFVAGAAVLAYTQVSALQTPPDPLLVVRAAIGDRADSVQARSSHPVRFPDEELSTIVVETAAVFEYADPERGFRLPPTRFVWINQGAGRVYSILTTPQLEAAPWNELRALTEQTVRTIDAAGWPRAPLDPERPWATAPGDTASFEDLREFFSDTAALGDSWPAFRRWRSGEVEIMIGIRRLPARITRPAYLRETSVPAGAFLLNVEIESASLSTALYKRVYEKREAAGVELVTLTEWLREDRDP